MPIWCHIHPPESEKLLFNCDELAAFDSWQLFNYTAVHIAGIRMHALLRQKSLTDNTNDSSTYLETEQSLKICVLPGRCTPSQHPCDCEEWRKLESSPPHRFQRLSWTVNQERKIKTSSPFDPTISSEHHNLFQKVSWLPVIKYACALLLPISFAVLELELL